MGPLRKCSKKTSPLGAKSTLMDLKSTPRGLKFDSQSTNSPSTDKKSTFRGPNETLRGPKSAPRGQKIDAKMPTILIGLKPPSRTQNHSQTPKIESERSKKLRCVRN